MEFVHNPGKNLRKEKNVIYDHVITTMIYILILGALYIELPLGAISVAASLVIPTASSPPRSFPKSVMCETLNGSEQSNKEKEN